MTASLDQWLARHATTQPNAPFLLGPEVVSWREAEARVEELRRRLATLPPHHWLLLIADNDVFSALAALAALRAERRLVWVPSALTEGERARLAALAPAATLWTPEGFHSVGSAADSSLPTHGPDEPWWALVTSGSTGRPKLALRSYASLVDEGERYRQWLSLSGQDRILAALPLGHAFALGAGLAAALVSGATLVLGKTTSARQVARVVVEEDITFLPLVRALAAPLAALDQGRAISGTRLRVAMVGAGPVSEDLSAAFERKWGIPLARNYGSSETGALLATKAYDAAAGTGRPLPGVTLELLPPSRQEGALWVKLPHPPLGHWTGAGWEPGRLAPDGWWSTGDLFVRQDGNGFRFLARSGGLVRRGGHAVAPQEVADALLAHPDVEDAVVAAEPATGATEGTSEERLVATVKMRRGVATDEAALRAHLRRTLAPFKQPDRISMVADLARTWSGKPALPAPPAPPAPSASPDFLGLARGYRTSVAVAAAQEAGLWDAWDRHAVHGGVSVANLAAELSLSPAALSIFCDVLMSLGLVQEGEGQGRGEDRKLRSLVPAAAWRASVLALESRLQQSWLTPAAVASVLRAGPHERPFLAANDEDFARVYGAAMTNDAQEAFLRSLLRHVRGPRPRVWEIGRGLGLVASLLAERHALRSGRLSPIAPGPAVLGGRVPAAVTCDAPKTWAELVRADAREEGRLASPPQTFDVIAVVNAIHWVDAPSLRPILVALRRRLAPGGTLMIVDTFLPRQGSALAAGPSRGLGASVLLDWLTHGGLFFFDAETVTSDLEAVFGAPIDVRRVPGFESVAICADNKRVTNGSEQHDGDNQGQVEDRVGEGVAARAGSGVAA